jgi:hypothetical protein
MTKYADRDRHSYGVELGALLVYAPEHECSRSRDRSLEDADAPLARRGGRGIQSRQSRAMGAVETADAEKQLVTLELDPGIRDLDVEQAAMRREEGLAHELEHASARRMTRKEEPVVDPYGGRCKRERTPRPFDIGPEAGLDAPNE